eukprot:SAG11_NODE_1072_length_5974_cov_1.634553_1_plen_28_part_10
MLVVYSQGMDEFDKDGLDMQAEIGDLDP